MKISQRILVGLLLFVLLSCSKESTGNETNQYDQTTVPQNWQGPTDSGVVSRDLGLCGKSDIAKKMNLPGFIMINFTNERLTYRSSEKVVQYSHDRMVDSGYKLGNLSLWTKKDSTDEIYIGVLTNKNQIKKVAVYRLGACN